MSEVFHTDGSHNIQLTKFVCNKCHQTVEQFWIASIGKYRFCDNCYQNFWEFIAGLWVGEK